MSIIEMRMRNQVADRYIAENMAGRLLTDRERVLTLNPHMGFKAARILQPDGRPLAVYLPGAIKDAMGEAYGTLQKIRGTTNNRGQASGTQRYRKFAGSRTYAKEITSNIIGSFDAYGTNQYCRLTAYNAKNLDEFEQLVPLFRRMSELFAEHVPERFEAQLSYCRETQPDWVIPGTVYTTITINSTYPTGVHTDKGDLDEGFSCLAVGRRGEFSGGILTFPAYGVGVDMQDGDMILMDAHAWHGNTNIRCADCEETLDRPGHVCEEGENRAAHEGVPYVMPERISVVAYYRTGMKECGSLQEEVGKREKVAEGKLSRSLEMETA